MPVKVQELESNGPMAVNLNGNIQGVVSIDERWEDAEDWWKDNPVNRTYCKLTLQEGRQVTVIRTMAPPKASKVTPS